jgi:hypothetical protein
METQKPFSRCDLQLRQLPPPSPDALQRLLPLLLRPHRLLRSQLPLPLTSHPLRAPITLHQLLNPLIERDSILQRRFETFETLGRGDVVACVAVRRGFERVEGEDETEEGLAGDVVVEGGEEEIELWRMEALVKTEGWGEIM